MPHDRSHLVKPRSSFLCQACDGQGDLACEICEGGATVTDAESGKRVCLACTGSGYLRCRLCSGQGARSAEPIEYLAPGA
jgi:hypothetical protein